MNEIYFKSASTPFAKDAIHLSIEKIFEKVNRIEKGDIVAVKLHMGELGNNAYVRPFFIRKIVNIVKKAGGKPFITDTTTLYGGHRGNAIDYLYTASMHGFSISSMNCPIIIADGLLGKDEEIIDINGEKVAVAKAIIESDYLLAVSHFKGHGMTGFGGAIKNVGMGCCSKAGKAWQHSASKPAHDKSKCIVCKKCLVFCPSKAIYEKNGEIFIDYEKCKGCGACTVLCEQGCFYISDANELQRRIAIACKAIIQKFGEKVSFINFLTDITPRCDCCSFPDKPLINDIGILSGSDIVAIDKASYDLVCNHAGKDIFYEIHKIDGKIQLIEGEKVGVGKMEYKLIEI
ncbi:MAG: DUF362 domain-containing protein [Candidatus Thermoplasmatota archaeon]